MERPFLPLNLSVLLRIVHDYVTDIQSLGPHLVIPGPLQAVPPVILL